jgi:hypothetical protein
MVLDLQSLFGFLCTAALIGGDPATPPHPRILGSSTRALLVSQDRRHLFVTPCTLVSDRTACLPWVCLPVVGSEAALWLLKHYYSEAPVQDNLMYEYLDAREGKKDRTLVTGCVENQLQNAGKMHFKHLRTISRIRIARQSLTVL